VTIASSYTYFTLYGRPLTSRDVKDSQLEIVIPTNSASASPQTEMPSTDDLKRAKSQRQPKKFHRSKADLTREANTQRKLAKSMDTETELINIEDL
jgi:hypothetical protein